MANLTVLFLKPNLLGHSIGFLDISIQIPKTGYTNMISSLAVGGLLATICQEFSIYSRLHERLDWTIGLTTK